MREIALDTETTGLDPYTGHRIVEIGCVEMQSGIRTGQRFHAYLNPERDMPQEAERVHGISAQFLSDKPLFRHVADAFLEFIQDSTLIIHNAAFDMKFINAELERTGHPVLPMSRAIDTVLMARKAFPGQPASLDALCKRFGISLSSRTKHGALLDAELLSDVYLELCGGRQVAMGLDSAPSPAQGAQGGAKLEARTDMVSREFLISDAEEEAHKQLINRIKSPIWLAS